MRLEFIVELVLASFFLIISKDGRGMMYPFKTLEKNHTSSFISCSKVVSRMIEFYC